MDLIDTGYTEKSKIIDGVHRKQLLGLLYSNNLVAEK